MSSHSKILGKLKSEFFTHGLHTHLILVETLLISFFRIRHVKIHYTYKRNFFPRVKNLQVGQWRFIENFSVTPANGKYRPTSHKYKKSITGNSNVTNSELKIDDDFLTLTPIQAIMNGSLDSKKLVGFRCYWPCH
ncbi:unnamed protein product [Brassica oleracea]